MEETNQVDEQTRITELKDPIWVKPLEIMAKYGISRTTFWRLVRTDPSFPKGKTLIGSIKIWNVEEIDQWILSRELV